MILDGVKYEGSPDELEIIEKKVAAKATVTKGAKKQAAPKDWPMPEGVTKVAGGWNVFVSDKSHHISVSGKSQVYPMPKNLGKDVQAISIFGGLNVPIA